MKFQNLSFRCCSSAMRSWPKTASCTHLPIRASVQYAMLTTVWKKQKCFVSSQIFTFLHSLYYIRFFHEFTVLGMSVLIGHYHFLTFKPRNVCIELERLSTAIPRPSSRWSFWFLFSLIMTPNGHFMPRIPFVCLYYSIWIYKYILSRDKGFR